MRGEQAVRARLVHSLPGGMRAGNGQARASKSADALLWRLLVGLLKAKFISSPSQTVSQLALKESQRAAHLPEQAAALPAPSDGCGDAARCARLRELGPTYREGQARATSARSKSHDLQRAA